MKSLLVAVSVFAAGALYAADVPPVGSAAPDFSVPDAAGKTQSLSEYKGKYVVLEWFNPECPFVKKHYGSDNMQKLQAEYTDKGVVWLTIDSNAPGTEGNISPDQAQKIMGSWKTHQTALLLDPESKVAKLYGAKNTPNMVVINPEGKIVYEGAKRRPIRPISRVQLIMSKPRSTNHSPVNQFPIRRPNRTAAR